MRRLILLRHGKAEIAGLTGGDLDRPLAQKGRVEAAQTASWLFGAGFTPDRVVMSPSLRTTSTWDCARSFFPNAFTEVRETLYLGSVEVIMQVVDDVESEADTVMVVGHNPGLQDLGVRLAEGGGAPALQVARLAEGFPTAAACVFQLKAAGGGLLTAIYEPPAAPGQAPRWVFRGGATGAAG
jgi:phosphohistidine phosphatase